MSDRVGYFIVVTLLIIAAILRLADITTLPNGLHADEITNIRMIEAIRAGNIGVFYDIGGTGREGLYHVIQVFTTGATGAGTLGYRITSVWIGLLTVAATFAAGRRLINPLGGVCAAGLMAVSFWPILLSRQIAPSAALPLFVALTLLFLAQVLPIYRRRRQRGDMTTASALLGAVLGLSLYVHPAGLLVVVFSSIFILYMMRTRRQVSRRRTSYLAFMALIALIISVPYLVSTIRNPDLSGLDRLTGTLDGYTLQASLDSITGLIVNGDTNPVHNLPGRALFDPFSALLIGVGLAWVIWKRDEPRHVLILTATLVLSPVFLFSADSPNFQHYTAALPILAILFGAGVAALHDNLPRPFRRLAEICLVALVVLNINTVQIDANRWRELPAVQTAYNSQLATLAAHIDRTSHQIPTVICGWRVDQSPNAIDLNNAQHIALMLNRTSGANIRYADCRSALIMTRGGQRQQVIFPDTAVLERIHPAIYRWLELGEFIENDALPAQSVLMMDVEQPLADWGGQLTTGETVSYAPEAGGTPDQRFNTPIMFSDNLTLLGYILPEENYQPDELFSLISYWRIQGRVPADLRLFTHILSDPDASPPANTDVLFVNPRYLRERDIIVQVTTIPLPPSLPNGQYYVSVGGYRDISDIRLNVIADGQIRGTRLFLRDIIVQSGAQ